MTSTPIRAGRPSAPLTLVAALVVTVVPVASGQGADIPRPEHPEPQAVREHWENLNGSWQFRFDPEDRGLDGRWFEPGAEGFDREIVVPFPWESTLSGIGEVESSDIGWYRRAFRVPEGWPEGRRVWLRFGAVDHRADVWVNGTKVAEHEGGYTPFEADVTDALADDGENVLVVRAFDPTARNLPTGKQIDWYTPSSGIWQTVWLEGRPSAYIDSFQIMTEIDPAKVKILVRVGGVEKPDGLSVAIAPDDPTVEAATGEVGVGVAGSGGIEARTVGAALEASVSEAKLWSPESPHLYDVALQLKDAEGNTIDSVRTYFGLRTIARGTFGDEPFERFLLNGKPVYIRGALDQSFNPDGLYTAPSDEYLRRDIASARVHGLNCLRIHIKTEEPRRLYWADKYGLLIMQDIPNTWDQDATARASWEATMREAVARDRNHPSIWSWVAFNETWGLGRPQQYREDKDTQQWVDRMVDAMRALDPTRLIEDMSPCNYDHIEDTDINSWHFYIDDYEEARRHIEEVVSRTEPGSEFNYVPGQRQGTAPLMNSEYGNVSAGGGDRDISWGFRYLTTQLRKHNKIQGYIFTELTDLEWEHNGFLNYDRTPKVFGYDAFLPDMWVNELNQADFVGFDAPPAIVGQPGETIEVPVFISHYSALDFQPALRWWVQGLDARGNEPMVVPPESYPAKWEPYKVTWQEPIRVTLPDHPFVGALILTLRDPQNRRFSVNYVNLVVQPEEPAPRARRSPGIDREAVLRFDPEDYAVSRWSEPADAPAGKVYGRGHGYFEYRLAVPEAVAKAKPESFVLLVEAAAKAGRERVDWSERVNPQDYPQTDARPFPSTLVLSVNGERLPAEVLEDDPADARGVLSHLAGVEHGSFGYLFEVGGALPEAARRAIAAGEPLVLRFEVPEDAEHVGGLALFGDTTGRFPIDPTIEITTAEPMPADLGVDPAKPVALDTAASRRQVLLPTGEAGGASWSYTTSDPGDRWAEPDFDASSWTAGRSGFGTGGTPGVRVKTRWDSPTIWIRTEVDLPDLSADDELTLRLFHDEDAEVCVNGRSIVSVDGYVTSYEDHRLDAEQRSAFRPGRNVIAVRCRQTGGGQGIDLGLTLLRAE